MLTFNQEQLIYFINTRESIRLAKEGGCRKPWTNNKVLQENYFCNINRENDKVTRWLRLNWTLNKYTENNYEFAMVVARIFNLPECLENLGQPVDESWFDNAYKVLESRKLAGFKIWNGAYIISTNGIKMEKSIYCLDMLKKAFYSDAMQDIKYADTCQHAYSILLSINGLGSFLAAQVVADLKNTTDHELYLAHDWDSFCAQGPGSMRGLTWFFENKVSSANFQDLIFEARELVNQYIPIMCMQDFQNCLCEYDKFMRVSTGSGRSKRKYEGK